ncbi:PGAP2-interacting protein-like [Saccostrea cucullata]|uniref:PGAP2-interacting protein-like n=1 Tax=Saccostrea cuccullata TaxID=36930 RepID=UPI002ED1BFDA
MEDQLELLSFRSIARETINGYVFWSLFQGLGPMIWFYPLNELDISGYEAFAATWFSPILLGIPGMLSLVQNRWVLGLLRLLMVGSLASFQAPTTLTRLMILAGGAGVQMLVLAATLWSPDVKIRSSTFWGLFLGLLSLITSRIFFASFIPTWWSNTTNSAIIAIAVISTIDQIISGADIVNNKEKERPEQPYWLPTAFGFGSLIYLTHWCFGEVSLITRWVVTGYPDHGPMPYPWGIGVFLCLVFGFYMSACRHVAQSKIWWLIGALSLAGLYYLPTYQGYTAGLVLGVYTMSIWPEMADRVSRCPPGRSLVVAVVTYLVEIFFFVWTVAYNFVPGGVYTREHTDYLIATVMLGIFIGLFIGKSFDQTFTALPVVEKKKISLSKVNIILGLILCCGLTGFATRYSQQKISHPAKVGPEPEFSAMIWTYHFGYDNKGWPSLERSAKLINETGADFVTLLESDASKPFLGNNDLGMWLGEKLGMYVDFGPATKTHTWGNLILSKYPIVKSTHHLLPSPHGELAPAISATVDYGGRHVDYVVTHMGNDRDVLDRELQAKFLARELRESKNPVVFLGYVTSAPGSRDYRELLTSGNVKDIDETDKGRWCEYIMYRGLRKLGYARITHGGLSDTEVQMAKFQIPKNPDKYQDYTRLTTDPSQVDPSIHFNKRFGSFHRGHGYFSDHQFHMSTPKYFLP